MPDDHANERRETIAPSKYRTQNGQRPFSDAEIDNLLTLALVVSEGLEQLRREGRLITEEDDQETAEMT